MGIGFRKNRKVILRGLRDGSEAREGRWVVGLQRGPLGARLDRRKAALMASEQIFSNVRNRPGGRPYSYGRHPICREKKRKREGMDGQKIWQIQQIQRYRYAGR